MTRESSEAWEPAAGDQIGGYTLAESLGRGGMATVWAARQQSLERPVAIKILHRHLADDAELRRRFQREAEALALGEGKQREKWRCLSLIKREIQSNEGIVSAGDFNCRNRKYGILYLDDLFTNPTVALGGIREGTMLCPPCSNDHGK